MTDDQKRIEDIRKSATLLASKVLGGYKRPDEPPKKEETTPAPAPEPPKKEETGTPPTPDATPPKGSRKKKKSDEPPALSPEDTARLAATTAAEVVARQQPPTPAPEPAKPLELPEEFEQDRPIYERMELENPKKYGGLVKKLSEYAQKETEHIEQWMAENPGAEYDPDSEEHDEFYNRHQPRIDPADVEAIKDSIKEDRIRGKVLQEISPELNELRRNKAIQAAAPKFQEAAQAVVANVLEGINPEYAKHATDKDKLNEIGEADPIAADVGQAIVNKYVNLATEAVALHNGIPFDAKNPAHMATFYRIVKIEDRVKAMPPDQQIYEGRRFATRDEYARMTPAQKANHWIVGEESVLYDISLDAKKEADTLYKAETERHNRYSKRNGKAPATNTSPPPPPAPAPQPQRASAPSIVPAPAVTPGTGSPTAPAKSGADRFHERLVGAR